MIILTKDSCKVSRWSGGTTTQIAIMPPDAAYGDRDFLWRASSAVVEDEESVFTPLPEYDRWLLLLEGTLDLVHDGGPTVRLEPYQAHPFDGGSRTIAQGRCTDFNLMLRKGKSVGSLRPLLFSGVGEREVRFEGPLQDGLHSRSMLVFCGRGGGILTCAEGRAAISKGEGVLLEDAQSLILKLSVSGPAAFVVAEMQN